MQCFNCKHDFCWMCLGNWRTHGSEYYECSRSIINDKQTKESETLTLSLFRYKENPNIANESVHAQAREALKKYLHYFERVSDARHLENRCSDNDNIHLSVGESLKKFETRGCDTGKNQKPHHGEGDGRVWDLDRLAISV